MSTLKKNVTSNPKLSKEKFSKDEIDMIKDIKRTGYYIFFYKDNSGAEVKEPFISSVTKKQRLITVCNASQIKRWDGGNYPLKKWHKMLTKIV